MSPLDVEATATQLLAAWNDGAFVEPMSAADPDIDMATAYEVLGSIARRRRALGWRAVGRKIGFTNTTIWPLYGVDAPMWAHMWDRTMQSASGGRATLSLDGLVQPRIEPEVVLRLRGALPPTEDPAVALGAVDAIAAGFEIVQCHFPEWKFTLPDCTAAFALHAAVVVGAWVPIREEQRSALVDELTGFEATLRRDGDIVDRGAGANVLGGPAHALAHLARVVDGQPEFEPLAAGEIITTGTVTNAWPVTVGETWTCDYGDLGLPPVELTFT